MSATSITIGIAGGGLLGRLIAWRLVKQAQALGKPAPCITVFDAGEFAKPAGACWVAAGMLSPLSEVVHCPAQVFEMGMESIALWKQWCSELEQTQKRNMHFRQDGSLIVAHGRDQNELNQFYVDLKHKLAQLNLCHDLNDENPWVDSVNSVGIRTLEPALSHFNHGLFLKPEGDLNNRRILHALHNELTSHGVTLIENTKVQCEANAIRSDEFGKEHGKEQNWSFDLVIDTRGNGAKSQLKGLRGVRGEVLVVESHDITLKRPVRLMHPRYKLYVVPKPNNQFVIGATEIESSDMSPMSLQSNLELSSALYTLNPAFAESRIVEQSVHCRPSMMDNLPIVTNESGFIQANGLYRHGYLLSPVVVNQVLERVAEQFEVARAS